MVNAHLKIKTASELLPASARGGGGGGGGGGLSQIPKVQLCLQKNTFFCLIFIFTLSASLLYNISQFFCLLQEPRILVI